MSIRSSHAPDGIPLSRIDRAKRNDALTDQLPWGFFSLDAQGTFVYRNPCAARLCIDKEGAPLADLAALLEDTLWQDLGVDETAERDVQPDNGRLW